MSMAPSHSSPLISIGVPAYNRAAGIERAVNSVLEQGYPNLEILISDNGSTDNTQEVGQRLAAEHPQVRYFRHSKNQGPTANFRFVLKKSSGNYFMWLADDDWLEPGILSRYATFLETHPEHVLVTGNIVYWKHDEEVYNENNFTFEQEAPAKRVTAFFRQVFVGGLFHSLFRADIARATPLLNVIGFDWFFSARMLMQGKAKNLPQPGYHKACLGLSVSHVNFARAIGASRFAAYNPYLNSCYNITRETVLTKSTPYSELSFPRRIALATHCSYFVIRTFYLKRFRASPLKCVRDFAESLFRGFFARDYQQPRRNQPA